MIVSHLPFGPTGYFTLSNTVMRHDIPNIGTMSEVYPHLIFNNFKSKLGERVSAVCVVQGRIQAADIPQWINVLYLLSQIQGLR